MNSLTGREQRIARETELLERLKRGSSIFDFCLPGDEPDLYLITFNGKGVSARIDTGQPVDRDSTSEVEAEIVDSDVEIESLVKDVHRVEIRLTEDFPEIAPEIRWRSGLLHPNVSFSGIVDIEELGLRWQPEMTLDVVCDRLWDVNRLAYVNLAGSTNHTAKTWFERDCTFTLPVDSRPLRNRALAHPQNIVSYRRVGNTAAPSTSAPPDLMFIGDDDRSSFVGKSKNQSSGVAGREATKVKEQLEPVNDDGIFFIN